MIYLYLVSTFGFMSYVAVFAWRRFESSGEDFNVLTSYIHRTVVLVIYAMVFGIFGLMYNLDGVMHFTGNGFLERLTYVPDAFPLIRSFSVGLAGPLAAAQIVSTVPERTSSDSDREPKTGTQVDDISNYSGRKGWFVHYSRALF